MPTVDGLHLLFSLGMCPGLDGVLESRGIHARLRRGGLFGAGFVRKPPGELRILAVEIGAEQATQSFRKCRAQSVRRSAALGRLVLQHGLQRHKLRRAQWRLQQVDERLQPLGVLAGEVSCYGLQHQLQQTGIAGFHGSAGLTQFPHKTLGPPKEQFASRAFRKRRDYVQYAALQFPPYGIPVCHCPLSRVASSRSGARSRTPYGRGLHPQWLNLADERPPERKRPLKLTVRGSTAYRINVARINLPFVLYYHSRI